MKAFLRKIPGFEIKLNFPLVLLILMLVGFLTIITRRAWLNDDAYITFRTVDNFVNGFRLTWNTTERVQSYTHPLWMFTLSIPYFFTHEIFYTAMAVSIMISFSAVLLYSFVSARSVIGALAGLLILGFSNAFVDYSTSGLANPLTHLLMVLFFIVYFRCEKSLSSLFWLSFISSLAALNRIDIFLFYLPPLLYMFFTVKEKFLKKVIWLVIAQAPILLWELFSVFYYGFPFPNTYYAKLHTGIPAIDLARQGLNYFLNSIRWDHITLIAIICSLVVTVLSKKKKNLFAALGIGLYLLYIVKIGGDFMAGRFFAAPLFAAIILLAQFDFRKIRSWMIYSVFAVIIILGVSAPLPTFHLGDSSVNNLVDQNLIVDERVWYFWDSSFVGRKRGLDMPNVPGRGGGIAARNEAGDDMIFIPKYNVGVYGYYAGPNVHVIDSLGLADPLMARMPAFYDVEWRIGHFERTIPDGYVYSFYAGENLIADKDLALFYDKLAIIVKQDLFDPQRFVEIWKMNTGQYDHLIDFEKYRYPGLPTLSIDDISDQIPPVDYVVADVHKMWDVGLNIEMVDSIKSSSLEVSLQANDDYRFEFYNDDDLIETMVIRSDSGGNELVVHNIDLSSRLQKKGFDRIHIYPVEGDEYYILGHLVIQ